MFPVGFFPVSSSTGGGTTDPALVADVASLKKWRDTIVPAAYQTPQAWYWVDLVRKWYETVLPVEYRGRIMWDVEVATRSKMWPQAFLPTTGTPDDEAYANATPLTLGDYLGTLESMGTSYFAPKSLVDTVTTLGVQTDLLPTDEDLVRRVWLELSAYHLGCPLHPVLPGVAPSALWVITDGSQVTFTNPDDGSNRPQYAEDAVQLVQDSEVGNVVVPILEWREFVKRRKGMPLEDGDRIHAYGWPTAVLQPATATTPPGIRLKTTYPDGPVPWGPAKLLCERTRPTAHTVLVAFSFNNPTHPGHPTSSGDWVVRFGVGHLWFTHIIARNALEVHRWDRTSYSENTGIHIPNLMADTAQDWTNHPIQVLGISVDTAQNRLAAIGTKRVYEWVAPPTVLLPDGSVEGDPVPLAGSAGKGVYRYGRTGSSAHDPVAVTVDDTIQNVPRRVNFTDWKNGNYVANDGSTLVIEPDPTPWDPQQPYTWVLGMGSLENYESIAYQDITVFEVRGYDRYLSKDNLAHEACHIRDTVLRRTHPPTVT